MPTFQTDQVCNISNNNESNTGPAARGFRWQRQCCCWPFPRWPHRGCIGCQKRCRSPNRWGWRWCSAWANLHSCSPATEQDGVLLPLDVRPLSAQSCLLLRYCHLFSYDAKNAVQKKQKKKKESSAIFLRCLGGLSSSLSVRPVLRECLVFWKLFNLLEVWWMFSLSSFEQH